MFVFVTLQPQTGSARFNTLFNTINECLFFNEILNRRLILILFLILSNKEKKIRKRKRKRKKSELFIF